MKLNLYKRNILTIVLCSLVLSSAVPANAGWFSWPWSAQSQSGQQGGSNFWKLAAVGAIAVIAVAGWFGYKKYKLDQQEKVAPKQQEGKRVAGEAEAKLGQEQRDREQQEKNEKERKQQEEKKACDEIIAKCDNCSEMSCCGEIDAKIVGCEIQQQRSNQDRTHCCIDPKTQMACFIVADGHDREGEIVADAITAQKNGLCVRLGTCHVAGDVGIKAAFKNMHDNILSRGGAAVVSAYVKGADLYLAHAGDSRAVLIDGSGKAVFATKDHKPDDKSEKARIEAAGGDVSLYAGAWRVNGLAMSRSLGDKLHHNVGVLCTPDVIKVSLNASPARFLILASDGVWDVVSNEMAAKIARDVIDEQKQIPVDAAQALVARAKALGSSDDISAIVVDLQALQQQFQSDQKVRAVAVAK
jgi:serine/threonine protein phosphatase PrpC